MLDRCRLRCSSPGDLGSPRGEICATSRAFPSMAIAVQPLRFRVPIARFPVPGRRMLRSFIPTSTKSGRPRYAWKGVRAIFAAKMMMMNHCKLVRHSSVRLYIYAKCAVDVLYE